MTTHGTVPCVTATASEILTDPVISWLIDALMTKLAPAMLTGTVPETTTKSGSEPLTILTYSASVSGGALPVPYASPTALNWIVLFS